MPRKNNVRKRIIEEAAPMLVHYPSSFSPGISDDIPNIPLGYTPQYYWANTKMWPITTPSSSHSVSATQNESESNHAKHDTHSQNQKNTTQ